MHHLPFGDLPPHRGGDFGNCLHGLRCGHLRCRVGRDCLRLVLDRPRARLDGRDHISGLHVVRRGHLCRRGGDCLHGLLHGGILRHRRFIDLCNLRGGYLPRIHGGLGLNGLHGLPRRRLLRRSCLCMHDVRYGDLPVSASVGDLRQLRRGMRALCSDLQGTASGASAAVASTTCATCAAGTYATSHSALCTSCPVGSYSASAAATSSSACASCPAGSYQASRT